MTYSSINIIPADDFMWQHIYAAVWWASSDAVYHDDVIKWTSMSTFWTKWWSGPEIWMTLPLPLCQNCGVFSSRYGLQFAQEGEDPEGQATSCACYSRPQRRCHTRYQWCGDMAISMFNRFTKNMVICHSVFFHDAIIWMRCFSTGVLP